MCSFLLLFLLLIVGFDFIQNSNTDWDTEKAESTTAPNCSSRLVLAPKRFGDSELGTPQKGKTYIVHPSFQGQQIFAAHFQADYGDGVVAVAVQQLPTNQQKTGYKVCTLLCTLDEWNSSQYSTQTAAAASRKCRLAGLGGMVPGMGRMGANGCVPPLGQIEIAISGEHTQCQIRRLQESEKPQRQQGPAQREGQRRKEQSKRLCQCLKAAIPLCSVGDGIASLAGFRE